MGTLTPVERGAKNVLRVLSADTPLSIKESPKYEHNKSRVFFIPSSPFFISKIKQDTFYSKLLTFKEQWFCQKGVTVCMSLSSDQQKREACASLFC
jgi:hypothetical protein